MPVLGLAASTYPEKPSPFIPSVLSMHFHTAAVVMSTLPLAVGWPQAAVVPSLSDAALLLAVAVTSFGAQLLLTRSFQLLPAARASSINFSQARGGWRTLV